MRVSSLAAIAVLASSGAARADGAGAAAGADAAASARAAAKSSEDPRAPAPLSVSAFGGYGELGDNELGNSWAPEQVPGAATVIGVRVGWAAVPRLVRRGWLALSLSLEAEFALSAASTGETGTESGGRMSYFAPVFGWRAHALLRQPLTPRGRLAVHVVVGGGGATVASSSPFMAQETDPVGYAGAGLALGIAGRWQLRADARTGLMPGRETSSTRVSELLVGVGATFGGASAREPRGATRPPPDAPDPGGIVADNTDTDGDGIADRLDRCPKEPESKNGIADDDGCPEPDPDADGVVGAADLCPLEAEDQDRFQDEDGCPDRDNDADGIADAGDVCPTEPETRNGFSDADGCPDTLPEPIARALASAAAVRFEPGRARVSTAIKRALQPVLAMLEGNAELGIAIAGAPDRAGAEDLAKRRAEAVKWYLVDAGIAEDRIETAVGAVDAKAPIAIRLR